MSAKNFLLTYNNPLDNGQDYFDKLWATKQFSYITGQYENGDRGTPHFQFFVRTHNKIRPTGVSKLVGKQCHIEIVKINNGAVVYCNKDEGRLEGPWTYGQAPFKVQSKSDWNTCILNIKQGKWDLLSAKI